MKVLWITSVSGKYSGSTFGSWVSCLQDEMEKEPDIELGLAFLHDADDTPVKLGKSHYFPIKRALPQKGMGKYFEILFGNRHRHEKRYIERLERIIADFRPDILHIWGCEFFYGEMARRCNIPAVIHIQGIITTCVNVFFPGGMNYFDAVRYASFKELITRSGIPGAYRDYLYRMKAELETLKSAKHIMGRTEFDRNVISLLAPEATYYHCDEMIRKTFASMRWSPHPREKMVLSSTISSVPYKGMDIVLKTARALKEFGGIDFEWNVFGVERGSAAVRLAERKFKIDPDGVDVRCHGVVSGDELTAALLDSDIYVHPSYIETGCNAVSEAQLLGVPVVAMYIGGLPTTCRNGAGLLLQVNHPYNMAAELIKLKKDVARQRELSNNELLEAGKRHDPAAIMAGVRKVYGILADEAATRRGQCAI